MPNEFLSPLQLEYLDGETWRVLAPFEYHLSDQYGEEFVRIPVGFVTDFASVPRVLWNVLPPTGGYGKAAVIHDWLYQYRSIMRTGFLPRLVERAEADTILKDAMSVLGVRWWTRWTIYSGVRLGGWKAWNAYRT